MTKYPSDRVLVRLGTVMPSEYNWREQINRATDTLQPFVPMDVGKVCGLAVALHEAEARIAELESVLEQLPGAVAIAIVHDIHGADEWRAIQERLLVALEGR